MNPLSLQKYLLDICKCVSIKYKYRRYLTIQTINMYKSVNLKKNVVFMTQKMNIYILYTI